MIPDYDAATRSTGRRGLSILGSTGSIGRQTLEIVRLFPESFDVRVLTARNNVRLLAKQAIEFQPRLVVIADEDGKSRLAESLQGTGIEIQCGDDGLLQSVRDNDIDVVMAAVVGFAGLAPVIEALKHDKRVALANKETLVAGGAIVAQLVAAGGGTIIPVDSEHSAIFQCLAGEDVDAVEELVLTASGGPFHDRDPATFQSITRAEALAHPNWSMGSKITIDSATMMNKGLEVIEARWLFDIPENRIRVLVHPQSIVHSMVAFHDGSVKAQLGVPDMKVPIQYALTYPERWSAPHERLAWHEFQSLDFQEPNLDKFPCLQLAYDALAMGGSAPVILNAANETAVELFLKEQIVFTDIPSLIARCLDRCSHLGASDLASLVDVDRRARSMVEELNRSAVH